MEKGRAESGWYPVRGSYEEAVLSWYEQIEASFRRRELDAQRIGPGTPPLDRAPAPEPRPQALGAASE